MRKIRIIAVRSKALSVACFLLPAVFAKSHILAQKFELAKLSLGMSEQDALTAIGPGYHVFHEPVTGFPNLLFVYTANPAQQSAYGFALIDGRIEAFSFRKFFEQGSYPLVETLRKSVAAKLWEPEKPNGTTWLSDREGRRLIDTNEIHCAVGEDFDDTRFALRNGSKISPADFETVKGMLQPKITAVNPRCGVFVTVSITPYFANQALAMSTGFQVKNIAAFSTLARQAQQQRQSEMNSQAGQAKQVKSPF